MIEIQPCPVCADRWGFHEDDCGAGIVVPGAWKPEETRTVREKVRLTDEEIAERRRMAALRAAVNERVGNGISVTIRSDGVRSWIEEAGEWADVSRETVAESDGS